MPKVSIVIPTHNRASLLQRAINSARGAAADAEIIVVDDASTDETHAVCLSMSGITYLRLEINQGLSAARNAGIRASTTEYVAFLDDDDLRLPHKLDLQLQALESKPAAAFCYGACLLAEAQRDLPTGEVFPEKCLSGDIFWELLETNFIPMPTVVARKTALLEIGLFDKNLPAIEDWDMWLRLSERSPVVAIDEPVAVYRRANGNSGQMSQNSARLFQIQLRVQQKAFGLPRASAASRRKRVSVRRKLIARAHRTMLSDASAALGNGDRQIARQKIRDAFSFRPFRTMLNGRSWMLLAQR